MVEHIQALDIEQTVFGECNLGQRLLANQKLVVKGSVAQLGRLGLEICI